MRKFHWKSVISVGLGILFSGCTTIIINNGSSGGSGSHEGFEASNSGLRSGLSIGAWAGTLTESYGSVSVPQYIPPAWAAELMLGFHIGPFFLSWDPTYFAVGKIATPTSAPGSAYYLSLLSGEFGLSFQKLVKVLPLDVFVGYESGALAFSNGTQSSFGGTAIKVGADFFFPLGRVAVGLRGEYRWHSLVLQNFSSAPSGLSVSTTTYFLGPVLLF